jgi:hypothetical protein
MKRILWVPLAAAIVVSAVLVLPRALAQGTARPSQAPAAAPAAAAATPQRHWYTVNIVTVRPESVNEYLEFQKTQTIPLLQRGGIKSRDVWQSGAPFGEGRTYTLVTPIAKFADYDLEPAALRLLGAEAGRAYQEKNRRMLVSSRTLAIQDRAELSVMPSASFKPKAGVLTLTTVVSGHAAAYEAYVKNDLLPVLKRGNVAGYLVSRTTFGGDANEYASMQLVESYADIDKGPVPTRVLGEAAAQQLLAKGTPHIASVRRELLRYVPDLSFRVTTATENR